jgi:hypothetical protein
MAFYPRNAASQGACLTPYPSVLFTFRLVVESIKELEGASARISRLCIMGIYTYGFHCVFIANVFGTCPTHTL